MKSTQILIYDAILDGDAKRFRDQLLAAGDKPVELRINSVGGLVFEGYAIYNALLAHKGEVNVFIDGIAASMASYIAMAGNHVTMAANAMLMIHNPSGGSFGDADDMRKQAELLEKITDSLIDAYTRRTKMPRKKMRDMMDEETWLTAEMALELGFVDEVTEPLEVAARFDMSRFRNAPAQLQNSIMKTEITAEAHAALQGKLDTALKDLKAANDLLSTMSVVTAERDTLKEDNGTLIGEKVALTAQVTAQATEISSLKGQVTNVTGERDKATNEVKLIESFAKNHGLNISGIDRGKAVGEVPKGEAEGAVDGEALIKKYNTLSGAEAMQFYRDNASAIDAAYAKRNA